MKTKTCPQCASVFTCCSEKCWCSELPLIMPMDESGDCFCPKCLNTIIRKKIAKADSEEI